MAERLSEVLAAVLGEHCPVYDYHGGHFTMECEACDFILGGVDRDEAKRRFGEHHAAVVEPALDTLLAARLAPIEELAKELDAAARNRHHEADGAMQAAIAGRLRDALGGRP